MLEQVQEQAAALAAYEDDIIAAEANIAAARAALLEHVRAGIDALIVESGLTREEVLGFASGPVGEKIPDHKGRKSYALKSNKTLVYSRGRLPQWLVDAMLDLAYDPASAKERADFRNNNMIPIP